MSKSQQIPKANTPWIYNPWLDLVVGCGAWSAPLLLRFVFFALLQHANLVGRVLRPGIFL